MTRPGTLYVVATPIGNLEDITLRALRVLKEVGLVAAEDTRRTRALLTHFAITTPLVSYYDAVETRRVPGLLRRLAGGGDVALVSDAGTPGLSDPGYRLVDAAARAGIPVVAVPGPSALTAALAVAGLSHERFAFEGFLPARGTARARRLAALAKEDRTVVLFEAPHRLARTLLDLRRAIGDRPAVLCRELTKRFEEVRRATLSGLHEATADRTLKARGEITLVVAGGSAAGEPTSHGEGDLDAAIAGALEAAAREGRSVRDVVDRVAAERGGRRRDIYRRALALRSARGI